MKYMKRLNLLVLLALCLLATACQQDEWMSQQDNNNFVSVSAKMEEPSSRSTVDATTGNFTWMVGDQIGVFTSATPPFQALSYNTTNKFEGTLVGDDLKFSNYAVYPYSANHSISEGKLSVHLPDEYKHTEDSYVANTNALMVANIGEATSTLSNLNFYHAGGVLSVKVKNLPENTCGVKLTTNRVITGSFNVTEPNAKTPTITTTAVDASSNNTITITFPKLGSVETKAMQFFFPLPVGTGYTFKLEYLVEGVTEPIIIKEGTTPNNIGRAQLLMMPTLTLVSTGATPESAGYEVVTIGDKTTYVVYNATGLKEVATIVNATDEGRKSNITLADNIILSELAETNGSNWTPIGDNYGHQYTGTFDGQGYSITGLKITNVTEGYQGLIGSLGNGTVKNVKLIKCQISSSGVYVGGVVGYNRGGTISECTLDGESVLTSSYYTTANNGASLGGIVGISNNGSISNCHIKNSKIVSEKQKYAGGIVGEMIASTASGCTVGDNVEVKAVAGVGGIVGYIHKGTSSITGGSITGCKVEGTEIIIESTLVQGNKGIAGGIVGNLYDAKVDDCHVSGKVQVKSGDRWAGGIAGNVFRNGIIVNCTVIAKDLGDIVIEGKTHHIGGIAGALNNSDKVMTMVDNCQAIRCQISGQISTGGIVGTNHGYVSGCISEGNKVTGTERVGGIAGQNTISTIACYVTDADLTINQTDETKKLSIGSIVGANGSNETWAGVITGCYAYDCASYSAVGTNNCPGTAVYGTINACYFHTSGETVSSVSAVETADIIVTNNIIWGNATTEDTAVYLMNKAISDWNTANDSEVSKVLDCTNKWGNDYNDTLPLLKN